MKIVIDLPEEIMEHMKDIGCLSVVYYNDDIAKAIINGTPLPKGHGELIDKEVVLDMMNLGILEEYITTMVGVIPADK